MKRFLSGLISILLLLTMLPGCAEEKAPAPIGSQVWEIMPQLTYGVMEYEKLQILPWNSGRAEATSFYRLAETESGFYSFFETPRLEYADKGDLQVWVPVCSDADCTHQQGGQCSAQMGTDSFVIRNGRIYFTYFGSLPEVYSGPSDCFLISIAPNGSDRRFEFTFDEDYPATVAQSGALLTGTHWYRNVVALNQDGSYTAYCYRVGNEGTAEPVQVENWENPRSSLNSNWLLKLYGDAVVHNGVLSADRNLYSRVSGEEAEILDTSVLPVKFAYLSGDTLRFFRTNDGYYDMNIKTGEEVKLAEPQLENSFANIVLPNCILESTLMTYLADSNTKGLPEGEVHAMRLFDGAVWRDVALPAELQNADAKTFVMVLSVASDCVILYSRNMATYNVNRITEYYIIDLTADELTAEHMMTR